MWTSKLNYRVLAAGLALAVASFLIFASITPVKCHSYGDCVKYSAMAHAFQRGEHQAIEFPFNLRALAPWLVSSIHQDVPFGFQVLNFISLLFWVVLTYFVFLKLGLGVLEFGFFILWFLFHPLGFRLYAEHAISVDPLSYAFSAAIVFSFLVKRRWLLWLLIFVGLLAKESFLFVALCALLAEFLFAVLDRSQRKSFLLSLCGFLAVVIAYEVYKKYFLLPRFPQTQEWKVSSLGTIKYWLMLAVEDSNRFVVWLASVFVATGLTMGLLLQKPKFKWPAETLRQLMFLGLGALGYIAFGLVAGADMSRIIFNGNGILMLFFIHLAQLNQVSQSQKKVYFVLSLILGLGYVLFFPDMFEYGYYESKNVFPTLALLLGSMLLLSIAGFWFRRQKSAHLS